MDDRYLATVLAAPFRGLPLRSWLIGGLIVQLIAQSGAALAQRVLKVQPRIQVGRPQQTFPEPNQNVEIGFMLGPTAPIVNLFDRASDGILRRDWKFTLDCLQRVIDDPGGSMMLREDLGGRGAVFDSARRQAQVQLANLPPEAHAAYRLLHTGTAKRLYEQGLKHRDANLLYSVAERFVLTDYGAEAVDRLASWALDGGRPAETIRLLTELSALNPRHGIPDEFYYGKLAAAYSLLGRTEDARSALAELKLDSETDDSPRWADGITALRIPDATESPTSWDWPVTGGSASRSRRMTLVEPTLHNPQPWRVDLSGSDADSWRRVLGRGAIGPLALPVGGLVGCANRLFARAPKGVVALDADDLFVLWEADFHAMEESGERPPVRRNQRGAVLGDEAIAFDDYVAGGISLSNDLVLTISREGKGEYSLRRRDSVRRGWLSWTPIPALGVRGVTGTRLIALDQKSGRIRWARGRTGDADDPLGEAHFHGVPIEVEGKLWAAYTRDGEISLAVLDPKDGALVRSVSLVSVGRRGSQGDTQPVELAASDGLVFAPVRDELLFSVNAADGTVLWANQFNSRTANPYASRNAASTGFLPTPPIALDGFLIYAPAGGDELIAFDVVNGEVVWSTIAPESAYVIGAERGRVFAGGRSITCRSLLNGTPIWQTQLSTAPTGRAVHSGGLIHVPTVDRLVSLDAETGEAVRTELLPTSQEPLGNLLCINQAVYTIHSASVRKYVDLKRSYDSTLGAVANGRAAPADLVRLAWLELWRNEPERAYDVLRKLPADFVHHDSRRAEPAARARVEALLAMAGQTGGNRSGEEILVLLREAQSSATTTQDRLRCSLGVADQLVALGRAVEAYRDLWILGIREEAGDLVPQDQYVYQGTRAQIAARLAVMGTKLSADERAAIEAESLPAGDAGDLTQFDEGLRAARSRLRAVADLSVSGTTGQMALLQLGLASADEGRWAQAEQLIRESVRRNADARVSTAGLMRLARMYADMEQSGFGGAAALNEVLATLASDFADTDARAALALIGADPQPDAATVTDWVSAYRARLEKEPHGRKADSRGPPLVFLSGQMAWKLEAEANADIARMVRFGAVRPDAIAGRVVVIDPADSLACYDGRDGRVLWKTDLRLPGVFDVFTATRFRPEDDAARYAAGDGQTGVFFGGTGVFAVELSTGRRLWAKPLERTEDVESRIIADLGLSAAEGLVAMMLRPSRLTLARLSDGMTVWERDLLGESVAALQIVGRRVITVDERLERVHLFDLQNARLVHRAMFQQPDPAGNVIQLVMTENLLIGPVTAKNTEGIAAVDLETGNERWRMLVDKPLVELFEPKAGYVAVGLLGGDVRVLDAETGEVVLERRVGGAQGVVRGVMFDGTLVVQHFNDRSGVRASSLSALDVATDQELWNRDDVFPLWLNEDELRGTGGRLPIMLLDDGAERDRQNRRIARSVRVALLDLRTGKQIGDDIPLSAANQLGQFNGDYVLLPESNVLVISAQQSIHALQLKRRGGAAGGDL